MDILTKINWIDILAAIIVVRIGYVALQDGLSHEIFPLIGTLLNAAISIRYYHDLALSIQGVLTFPIETLNLLSILILVVVMAIVFKLLKFLVDAIVKVEWHPFVEKFGGLIFGLARALVVVSLMLTVMLQMPLSYFKHSIKDKSISGPYLMKIAPGVSNRLSWAMPVIAMKK